MCCPPESLANRSREFRRAMRPSSSWRSSGCGACVPRAEPMASEGFAVEVDGVVKRFGKLQALAGVSLRIRRGEVYGLLGPNGAGKTTLIRSLVGLVNPEQGSVTVLNRRMPNLEVLAQVG